jgi:DNA-binding transcriptional LysR family regulator
VLTIHQLEVFVMVADHGSLRAAAEELVVTQPAVSATLASLERTVGVELVNRVGRGIELNEAGRTMARYARVLLGMVDEAIAATRFAADPGSAPARVGATTAAADYVLMPLLARIRTQRPTAQFTVEVGNLSQTWKALADRKIDLAVSTRPPALKTFVTVATADNEFVLVAAPGAVWPGTLGQTTWLLREEGSSVRAVSDELMALLAVSPPTMTISSNAAIQRSAEAGLGVAVLPLSAVREPISTRTLSLIRAKGTPLKKPWHVLARTEEALTPAARQLVHDLVSLEDGFTLTAAGVTLLDQTPL